MAVTPKGIVYPSDYSEIADLPTDLQAMAESVDTALGNVTIDVDSALSPTSENPVQNKVIYTALEAKENATNKVTSISSSSTDTQYPSAKCVYDIVGDIETILETLDVGGGINVNS